VTPADRTIYVDPGSTTTITLYASSGATAGNIHTIKRYGTVSTYALTIAPDGSETIDVDTSIDLSMFGDSITIINTGSGWRILEYYMAPIVCQATLSTGTHTLNDNFQAVPFSSEDFDPAAAINAGTFTAPAAGKYFASGQVNFVVNGTNIRSCKIYKNTSTVALSGNSISGNGSIESINVVSVTGIVSLAKGDTLHLAGYQNSGGNLAYASSTKTTYFCVQRVAR
jgi:hypothetical protein